MIIAIDPGAISGAIAWLDDAIASVADLPVVDGQINAPELARVLRMSFNPAEPSKHTIVIERVASMPKQGVASTFKFGMSVGIIHGIVASLQIPMYLVVPTVWKKGVGLPTGADKEASRALAIRLYPQLTGLERKKDSGRAEALLLGHYWRTRGKS